MIVTIWMLFIHWIADFLLQTKWMAENKSSNWQALTVHVFVYSITMTIGMALFFSHITDACRFMVFNFVAHWIIDFNTSKLTKKAAENRDMHQFFCIVGLDQFLHACTLIATIKVFGNI